MGVFSEIAIDQCSQDGTEPFQMDAYVPPIVGWREQPNHATEVPEKVMPPAPNKRNDTISEDPEQETLRSIANMSDDAVMLASAQRVSRDTEKITRRNMKDCVSEVL